MSAPRSKGGQAGSGRGCQGCGSPLAADNTARLCSKCHRELRDQLRTPPAHLWNEFFETPEFLAAFESQHIGKVFKVYRNHPHFLRLYGKALNQEILGRWLGLTQAQVSKLENGKPERNLDNLINYARVLHLPQHLLWFKYPGEKLSAPQSLRMTDAVTLSNGLIVPRSPDGLRVWTPEYADSDYLNSIRSHIDQIVSLDNRFGGAELVKVAKRFFRTIHHQLGTKAYDPSIHKDLLALAGELAEVAGWLAYDANEQDLVRQMNNEALHFTRLAGNRSMELLILQNVSMHAGFLNRPQESLDIAEMILSDQHKLSPRLQTLFLIRKARALAQGGDHSALRLFGKIHSLYRDGTQDHDPPWAWWVNDCELAWHEAMCHQSLGDNKKAMAQFEKSVEATPSTQVRSQYLHRAYLLSAQIGLQSWEASDRTMSELMTLVAEVSSTRTALLIQNAIHKLSHNTSGVPRSIEQKARYLQDILASAPV